MLSRDEIEDLFVKLRNKVDLAEQHFINHEEVEATAKLVDIGIQAKRIFDAVYERNLNRIEGRGPDQARLEFPHPLETGDGSLRDLIYSRNRNR